MNWNPPQHTSNSCFANSLFVALTVTPSGAMRRLWRPCVSHTLWKRLRRRLYESGGTWDLAGSLFAFWRSHTDLLDRRFPAGETGDPVFLLETLLELSVPREEREQLWAGQHPSGIVFTSLVYCPRTERYFTPQTLSDGEPWRNAPSDLTRVRGLVISSAVPRQTPQGSTHYRCVFRAPRAMIARSGVTWWLYDDLTTEPVPVPVENPWIVVSASQALLYVRRPYVVLLVAYPEARSV